MDALRPLAIIQARLGSTRLPGKVLEKIGKYTLLELVWRNTCHAFEPGNVVVAIPANAANRPLWDAATQMGAQVHAWDGPEDDVLGRFYHVAHLYRWHPDTVIVRVTPDDPYKTPMHMRAVAFEGVRLPVEISCEAFTLRALSDAHRRLPSWGDCERAGTADFELPAVQGQAVMRQREHITHALFEVPPPEMTAAGVWTVDTPEDLETVRLAFAEKEFGA